MKLQIQVCSFEQGLKLRKLGIDYKQANYYWERKEFDEPKGFGIYFHFQKPHILGDEHKPNFSPAFTVAELGAMLGMFARNTSSLTEDGSEAVDRAADLIHLLEINELCVDSCNERLKN